MGFYDRWVVPRLVELATNTPEVRELRHVVTDGLVGDVLEIGFGSGPNMPFLPREVTRVLAVEPSDEARKLGEKRMRSSSVPVHFIGLDGESIPLPDRSVDSALSTLTLCTIPDVLAAIREVRRVLRVGGRFHFLEHGLSPDPDVAKWQHRLTPIQRVCAGGCHLNRDVPKLLEAAGFAVERMETRYLEKAPRPLGHGFVGVAR